MAVIQTTRRYDKAVAKLPRKIRDAAKERTLLFLQDRQNPLLRDHALHGRMQDFRAFSVTGDYRIIYEERGNGEIVFLFLDIGRHGEVYY